MIQPRSILTRYSYREELDEIIEYGDPMTSADVTEAETSDGAAKSEKKKKRRISKLPLPWVNNSDLPGESKTGSIFSFASSDDAKTKKLQKKKRPKESENHVNAIDLAVGIGRPGVVSTPTSELSQSERGLGTLSPQPWLQQSNISQSSLNASEFSRRSHVSSNRSSVEVPRSATPLERRPISVTPSTLDEIRQRNLQTPDDDLPTKVIMPAAQEDRPRAGSQSSINSAGSSSKGSKIGAWLRKKRGYSVSSSTSLGGGGGVVSD